MYYRLGHGIIPALCERMATAESARGHPRATRGAMADDGVAGIVGTRWQEAALRAQVRTQGDLVDAQQGKQDSLHDDDQAGAGGAAGAADAGGSPDAGTLGAGGSGRAATSSKLPSSAWQARRMADRLAKSARGNFACSRNRISRPANWSCRLRNSSRTMRFTRLRSAARGANFLPTTMPSRACGWPLARTYSTKCVLRRRGRKAKTDENSSVFVSLAALGKAWVDTLVKASGQAGLRRRRSWPS